MVYPEYRGGSYYRGPVVRMRVGDLLNATGKRDSNRGLPGVITSLDLNYDEATWELETGQKVPRVIDVSLGFHVLHEHPIGITAGTHASQFGGIFSGGGTKGQSTSYASVSKFREAFGGDYLNDPNAPVVNPSADAPFALADSVDKGALT
jgi:hypothetical protein